MFESGETWDTASLRALLVVLARSVPARDDTERIDQLALLERLKAVAAAAQARLTVDLVESQARVAEQAEDRAEAAAEAGDFETWRAERDAARAAWLTDVTASRAHRRRGADIGVQAQVALARRASPSQGSRAVRTALSLVRDLPNALTALTSGELTERRADLLVQETAVLSAESRRAVDAELADRWGSELGLLGEREIVRRVRAVCYRVDAASVVARAHQGESDRHVSLRPAPDTMTYLTALLPVAQGVAAFAALTRAADSARAAGDTPGKGQVMADTLVERLTGQARADAVPVEVQLVMTDRTLLAGDEARAHPGLRHGPGPLGSTPGGRGRHRGTLRGGGLAAAALHPSRRRDPGDDGLRTPWCDAPVRHLDPVVDHARGGSTSARTAKALRTVQPRQGARRVVRPPGGREGRRSPAVVLTTPSGHTYRSTAPPVLPGAPPGDDAARIESHLERHWLELLAA